MKKLLLQIPLILIALLFTQTVSAQHFTPVWDGNPLNSMLFYVSGASIDGIAVEAGDEIAAFDVNSCGAELCVGSVVLTGPISGFVTFQVSQNDAQPGSPPNGYTNGNSIIYRIWDNSESKEIRSIATSYFTLPPDWIDYFNQGSDVNVTLTGTSSAVSVIGQVGACPSSSVTVPVTVYGLENATAVSLKINYTNSKLSYDSYANVPSSLSGMSVSDDGSAITMTWSGAATTLNNETLIELTFSTLASGFGCLEWDGTSQYNGGALSADFIDGNAFISSSPSISSVTPSNLSCNGAADGSISVVASGSTETLYYSIDAGSTWQTAFAFNNLAAGSYTLHVKDANDCLTVYASNPIVITEPPAISITDVSTTGISCFGESDATITITASGGTGSLQYSINNGTTYQSSNSFTGLSAGTYNVVVKDDNDCTQAYASNPITISQPIIVSISNVVSTNLSCNGVSDGTITITASGGTGSLHYSIDDGSSWQSSNSFTGLSAGSYTIKVKDDNDCTKSYSSNPVIISEPPAITINNVASTDITCFAEADGTITVTATGGTGSLQYSIDNGTTWQSSNAFIGLSSGSYNVVVKDANDCEITYTSNPVTITEPTALSISNVVAVDVPLCYGDNTGSITVTASGGTGSLQYSVDNGTTWQSSNIFTGLIAGDYNVVVKDANDCEVSYDSNPVTIGQPDELTINNVTSTDPSCNGVSDGTITVTASGGTGTLVYSIDNGTTFAGNGGVFTGLAAGSYDVVVKDANDCLNTYDNNPVILTDPPGITISDVSTTTPLCNGESNATLTITATGGSGDLMYSIDDGVSYQDNGGAFTALSAGSYTIKVKDANDCESSYTGNPVVISDPSVVTISDVTPTDVSDCYGGTNGEISVTATGGTGSLYYSIDNGTTFQGTGLFTGLAAGDYDVVVKDDNDCLIAYGSNPVTIGQPLGISIDNITPMDVTGCYGDANGEITVTASGGTGSLFYSIDNGTTYQSSGAFTGLPAGSYDVIVKDDNDCEKAYDSNPVVIGQPSEIDVSSVMLTSPLCYGDLNGIITITASGGTGTLQYSIDGGTTYMDNGGTFTGLGSGSYNVMVKDANDCEISYDNNPVNLSDPTQISISSVSTEDPLCYGGSDGSIDINASGGFGTLKYSINDGVSYIANNGLFTNLSGGLYNVWVQDANECEFEYPGNPVIINQPSQIVVSDVSTTEPLCYDGSDGTIDVTASGGTGTFTYSIDDGTTYFDNDGSFTGLSAGSYEIMVMDDNACESAYANNPVIIGQPDAIMVTDVSTTEPSCNGFGDGTLSITASGGTGSLMYSIDNGATFQSNGGTYTLLETGSYNVVVKDENDCEIPYTNNPVIIDEPEAVTITDISVTQPSCFEGADGTLSITASGGTGSFMYSIDDGSTFEDNAGMFTGLSAGSYNVVVKDANDCMSTYSGNPVIIDEPEALAITSVDVTHESCEDCNDGSITVSAEGGTPPFMYSIDGGANYNADAFFDNLIPGYYEIVIKDDNDCELIYFDNPVGVDEYDDVPNTNEITKYITVYPNPTPDGLLMMRIDDIDSPIDIRIYDALQNLLYIDSKLSIDHFPYYYEIDLGRFHTGVYFLQIKTKNAVACIKIVSVR